MLQSAVPQSLSSMTHVPGSVSSNLPASNNRDAGGKAHSFLDSIAVRAIGKLITYNMNCLWGITHTSWEESEIYVELLIYVFIKLILFINILL
jgi:hypothetical protein